MRQYEFEKETLILKGKKTVLFARVTLFSLSIVSFLFPFFLIALLLYLEEEFHFGFIIAIFVFGFIGYYFLRLALWNTFGKEVIKLEESKLTYEADYKWFKDAKQSLNNDDICFWIKETTKNCGNLTINNSISYIETVSEIPIYQLQELIERLSQQNLSSSFSD